MHISDDEILEMVQTHLAREEQVHRDIRDQLEMHARVYVEWLARVVLAKAGYIVSHLAPADISEVEEMVAMQLRKLKHDAT